MEIEYIKANDQFDDSSSVKGRNNLRVAAYCRVSTDEDDQIKSYNSMVKHYTELIQNNKSWVFVDVYADKGISGTRVAKREEFQRLINDCLDGKIDLVLAKSLSRFARNTLDTIHYVRLLRDNNIAIQFEEENINTLKDGEFLMTILSSVAQQEVENTSAHVKTGLKMKMKRGELVGQPACLGYDYDPDTKSLIINEEGAETVRYIFNRYIAGAGATIIARELNQMGRKTLRGHEWNDTTVLGIVSNEKYKGDVLLGKTFTTDPISKRRLNNKGEEDMYYVRDHHEPIISAEIFDKAQEIRSHRNGSRNFANPGQRDKFSRMYAFSSMLECGYCGGNLSRRCWHSNTKHEKIIWQCVASTKKGKEYCVDSKGITEQVIERAFVESYRLLCTDNKAIVDEFLKRVEKSLNEESLASDLRKLQNTERNIVSKRKKLLNSYLEGNISVEVYKDADKDFENELSAIRGKIDSLDFEIAKEQDISERIDRFRDVLSRNEIMEEFDRDVFEAVVEKVIVGGYDNEGNKDPYKLTFIYKNGFNDPIDDSKRKFDPKQRRKEKVPSNGKINVKELFSNVMDDACGDGSSFVQTFQCTLIGS